MNSFNISCKSLPCRLINVFLQKINLLSFETEKLMKKRILLQILFSFALAFSIYVIGERVARWQFDVHSIDLSWGITLRTAFFVFVLLAIATGIVSDKLSKCKLLILSVVCVIILSSLIGTFTIRPFRTLLLCLSGIVGLVLPIIVMKR